MGLDITVYKNIAWLPNHEFTEDCWDSDHHVAWVNPAFPDSCHGINDHQCFLAEDSWWLAAGSYGGYNAWRAWLSRAGLGWEPDIVWDLASLGTLRGEGNIYPNAKHGDFTPLNVRSLPFYELINFSDCEGVISGDVCAELAIDFETLRDKVIAEDDSPNGYYTKKYDEWTKAFKDAAHTGLVDFH